jgi:6-phosphogluconolactonase
VKLSRTLDLGPKGKMLVAPDSPALFEAAAELFLHAATEAIKERALFSVALSGGSTPKALFELLASDPWRLRFDWSKVHAFWGDERWVPHTDSRSNYRMAYESLLSKVPIPEENIHPVQTEGVEPQEAAAKYEDEIRAVLGNDPQFDLNLLGMGTNGHTASLFPHQPTLEIRDRLVVSDYIDEVQMYRITFTVPLINNSRNILFLISGKEKAEALKEVVRGPDNPQRLPSQLIEATRGTLTWLVDDAAAQDIR